MPQFADMTAVILAGGAGTRLRSVVADRPKVMALVNGRPFLSYLLDELARFGIRHVVLCTGYMAQTIEAEFGAAYGPIHLEYSRETTPLGTGGGVRLALPLLKSDPILILNGDSFCKADLNRYLDEHCTRQAAASLLTARVDDVARYGQVHCDPAGRVRPVLKKKAILSVKVGSMREFICLVESFWNQFRIKERYLLKRKFFP